MQHIQTIAVMARVAITAPPAMTAISQMGSATFLPTYASLLLLSTTDGLVGVVMGPIGIVTISLKGLCVVSLDCPVLLGFTCIIL